MITRRRLLAGATVIVTSTALSGCSFGTDGEFGFDRVTLSPENPEEYDDYEAVPDTRTYTIDDAFYLFIALEYVPTDDDDSASLDFSVTTATPTGTEWDPTEWHEQWDDVDSSDVPSVWHRFETYPEDPPGDYEMEITVEDRTQGEALQTTESFTLEEGE